MAMPRFSGGMFTTSCPIEPDRPAGGLLKSGDRPQ